MTDTQDDWPDALPGPFKGLPGPDGPSRPAQLDALVDAQVDALVAASPAFAGAPEPRHGPVKAMIGRIARHAATLALEDWQLSDKLGQRPAVETRETVGIDPDMLPPDTLSTAQSGSGFEQAATARVGSVTQSTLKAISFPVFVSDLIKGTFGAILDATTSQMDSFMELLENVSKTVEQFENENVSDVQAAQWLAQQYPKHIQLVPGQGGVTAAPTDATDPPKGIKERLALSTKVDSIDDITIEEVLLPAARRKLAQSRLEMLSSLVMIGLQRVVINHGRIRATMGFQIDASDSASASKANLTDVSVGASGSFGAFGWGASVSSSVTYVSSSKKDSNAELDVSADLTGEVDLHFSTDYMPLNRLASAERLERIRKNTPVPEQNTPSKKTGAAPPKTSAGDALDAHMKTRKPNAVPKAPDPKKAAADTVKSAVTPAKSKSLDTHTEGRAA
ncbi:hypothetical protein [uncultured Tateyamaria sp.]|uniref:hypothetical protein n=1 Tax=Tateyamaria sp. 1078 TaxID=3417464 RepID=UPI00262B0B41|nr:hypothetical protein [uncultured Tateyamaria sp.]